jgi:hypothetical protein
VNKDEIVLPANFIRTKDIVGQNMRTDSSGVFPVRARVGKTMGHFLIDLIRSVNLGRNEDELKEL